MSQRVITEVSKIEGPPFMGFEIRPDGLLGQLLQNKYKIIHLSTSISGSYHFITAVVEEVKPYSGF
jgi:hypothetical protein